MKLTTISVRSVRALALAALACAGLAAVAYAGVVKYDTKLTISTAVPLYHGKVKSEVRKCERGRRVVLFEQRPGADRKVGADRSNTEGRWVVRVPLAELQPGDRFYAKVRRKLNIVSGNGYVCHANRSRTVTFVGD
jgi:hypothetical protein